MIPKTLLFAFMASCLVSSSVASPCKASSTATEVSTGISYSTTVETASTTTQSEGAIETSTVFQDSTTETHLSSTVTATTTVSQEEATPTSSDASSTTQPPTVPDIPIDCATDQQCDEALGRGIYACIDLLCQKTATAP